MDLTNEAVVAALGDQELDDSSVRARLPEQVVGLYSRFRHRLPRVESLRFAVDLADALGSRSRDLSLVWPRFAVWMLADPVDGVASLATGDALMTVQRVAALYESVLAGNVVTAAEWLAARDAATLTAAREAARAAGWAAASSSSRAAAGAATWAAAARSSMSAMVGAWGGDEDEEAEAREATRRQAAKLLELLQETPWT